MIYIMVLAYNEEGNIASLLNKIQTVMDGEKKEYRVIVVNDGSSDNTKSIVESHADKMPIQLLNHEKNRGVGHTFFTGISHACSLAEDSRDMLITMEGDNSNDPVFIPSLIGRVCQGYQVVVASRFATGGAFVGFAKERYVLTFALKTLMKMLFPIKNIRDYSIFYRAYDLKVLKKALELYGEKLIQSKGFASAAEILLKLRPFGIDFSEVPQIYRYDLKKGYSKIKVLVTIKEYLKMIYFYKIYNRFRSSNRFLNLHSKRQKAS